MRYTGRRGGRPPKSDEDRRDTCVMVRFTEAEAEAVHEKAWAAGLRPAVFLRELAVGAPIVARPAVPSINADTYTELGRIGGILNQCMRAFHRDARAGAVPPELLREALAAVQAARFEVVGDPSPAP